MLGVMMAAVTAGNLPIGGETQEEAVAAALQANADRLAEEDPKRRRFTGVHDYLGIGQVDARTGKLRSDRTKGRPVYPDMQRDTTRCVREGCGRRTKREKRRPPFAGAPKIAVWVCPTHGPLWPVPEAERLIAGVLDEVATQPNGAAHGEESSEARSGRSGPERQEGAAEAVG